VTKAIQTPLVVITRANMAMEAKYVYQSHC
jgi:hypothetical protein